MGGLNILDAYLGDYIKGVADYIVSWFPAFFLGAVYGKVMDRTGSARSLANKLVSVIGDSTFMHSGITGLVDIVYNKGANTVIILDNSITGMTGHQDNPTTGRTIKGEETRQVNLITLCKAVGVERVVVADPFDIKHFEEVVKTEVEADEPSVIITQRPCALLKTVKYTGVCQINDKCRNCKMCMKLGCPAITVRDGKVTIDATQCNGCGLCVNVCPFGAIEKKD